MKPVPRPVICHLRGSLNTVLQHFQHIVADEGLLRRVNRPIVLGNKRRQNSEVSVTASNRAAQLRAHDGAVNVFILEPHTSVRSE